MTVAKALLGILVLVTGNVSDVEKQFYFEEHSLVVTRVDAEEFSAGQIVAYFPRAKLFFHRDFKPSNDYNTNFDKGMLVLDPKRKEIGVDKEANVLTGINVSIDSYSNNVTWKISAEKLLALLKKEGVVFDSDLEGEVAIHNASTKNATISIEGKQYDQVKDNRSNGSRAEMVIKREFILSHETVKEVEQAKLLTSPPAQVSYQVTFGPTEKIKKRIQFWLQDSEYNKQLPNNLPKPLDRSLSDSALSKLDLTKVYSHSYSAAWDLFSEHFLIYELQVKVQNVGPDSVGAIENLGNSLFVSVHRKQQSKGCRVVTSTSSNSEQAGANRNTLEGFAIESASFSNEPYRNNRLPASLENSQLASITVPSAKFLDKVIAPYLELEPGELVCENGDCENSTIVKAYTPSDKDYTEKSFLIRQKDKTSTWKVWIKVQARRSQLLNQNTDNVTVFDEATSSIREVLQ